ncbi:MAG: hypothetical protein ABSE68_02325 [Minisyncoccia bacterium]
MDRKEKTRQAFRLVEAIVGGYAAHESNSVSGLGMGAWKILFKNCYDGVNAMLETANEIDPAKITV